MTRDKTGRRYYHSRPILSRRNMEHRRLHGLEKTQAQVVTLAALGVVFFVLWRGFAGTDPLTPFTFLPLGEYHLAGDFMLLVCILAAVCAAVTFTARPEGALLAALIGAGGVSLRSPQIRGLFWALPGQSGGIYLSLILETVMMAGALLAACVLIGAVRGVIARLRPGWLWVNPLERITEQDRSALAAQGGSGPPGSPPLLHKLLFARGAELLLLVVGDSGTIRAGRKGPARTTLTECLGCMGVTVLVAMVLMQLFLQSPDRGQIIFALFMSFTVAALVGHQVFPTRYGLAVWVLPLAAAIVFYALASLAQLSATTIGWLRVPLYAQALPVDWLTAGCGGAVLGYWISWRIHELRLMEAAQEAAGK